MQYTFVEPDGPFVDYGMYRIDRTHESDFGITQGPCFGCKNTLRHFSTHLLVTTHKMSVVCVCGYCGHTNTLAEAAMTTMTREPLCKTDSTP